MDQTKTLLAVIGIVVVGGVGYGVYSYMQSENDDQPASSSQTQNTDNNVAPQGDQEVQGDLVAGFPGDKIPLYLGDVVDSKSSTDSFGKPEYNVRIKTTDDITKVVDRSETSYMNEGWDIKGDISNNMFVSHSDEHIVTVSFSEDDDGVLINYGISTK